jgi:hypothetical protein
MVPFVPFVVLAGNAVATSSEVDLALLDAAIVLMLPVAIDSPMIRSVCTECEHLYHIAEMFTRPNREFADQSSLRAMIGFKPNSSMHSQCKLHSA